MLYDVFISYSRKDSASVNLIYSALRQAQLRVWLDRGRITYGSPDWRNEIETALRQSACILYIASFNSYRSENVREELAISDALRLHSFVALVDDSDSLPYGFNRAHRANLHQDVDGTALTGLIDAIQKHITAVKNQSTMRPIAAPRGKANPFVRGEERDQQPLDFIDTRFLMGLLEAAAELMPVRKYKGRAALYWVDEANQELYIVAATEHFEEAELRTRLKEEEGFAGMAWSKRLTECRDPKTVYDHIMRNQWRFSEEQIALMRQLGVVVAIPIFRPSGRIAGVLWLDSMDDLSPNEILTNQFDRSITKIIDYILKIIEYAKPISARNYRNLSSIIHSARLLAPMDVKARAGIFYVDDVRQELFMLAGSDDFARIWANDLRFKKGQGLVGTVWNTHEPLDDNRNAADPQKLSRYLREKWSMTEKQITISIHTQSILCVPIWADQRHSGVIGVLLVDSAAPANQSNLTKHSKLTLGMMYGFAQIASKIIQHDRALGSQPSS